MLRKILPCTSPAAVKFKERECVLLYTNISSTI